MNKIFFNIGNWYSENVCALKWLWISNEA